MSHQSELISTDINAYLAQHEKKELLRFLTCGSVDDGKSTLIGRLLHDSQLIYEDQLAAIKADSVKSGTTELDLALLVDGLQAEREQGITIDVAYRYFSTAKRKFIIVDAPGHEQYTRNMATGASTCDLAIILIDARKGILAQTKRHTMIAFLLGIEHIIVAVNKMDLLMYDQAVYHRIKADYDAFIASLYAASGSMRRFASIQFIPISALKGDNVVKLSTQMAWYAGRPLLNLLETGELTSNRYFSALRFPVQYVNRPHAGFRGYCGTVAAGVLHKGDQLCVLPSGKCSTVRSIITYEGELEQAFPQTAVTITLADEIDVSRGDMLVCQGDDSPLVGRKFSANIIWMAEQSMLTAKQYYIKFANHIVSGSIAAIHYRFDINTLERQEADELHLNEIASCDIITNTLVVCDPYFTCKRMGAFIVIDRMSNVTVGAGMVLCARPYDDRHPVGVEERYARYGQKGCTVWLSGKNNLRVARRLERRLFDMGCLCVRIDALENKGMLATIGDILCEAGIICLCTVSEPIAPTVKHGILFNCEGEDIDFVLEQIRERTQL